MIVRPAPASHLSWLAERAKLVPTPGLRAIECVDGDRIVGMVGYDNWLPSACQMHVALDEPAAALAMIRTAFGIPFNEFGFVAVLAPVVASNASARKLVEGLGFKMIHRGVGYAGGVDLLFYEMRREDCRWIREEAA